MTRHLIIVAQDDPRLYGYLIERFGDDKNVAVILDRRSGSDRRSTGGFDVLDSQAERRKRDRRVSAAAEDELRLRRHVVVTRPPVTY